MGKWSDWYIFSTGSCEGAFFYVGKTVCLRGGQEQRNLKLSQFRREYDPDRYIYVENGSKNHPGTFGQKKQSNKVVTLYSHPDAEPRCVVYLLDFYFSKFPQPASTMPLFYLKPLAKKPADREAPWFQATAIGKNTLAKFVEKMCEDAGIKDKKSNHSLRATGATAMFAAGVPEKLVKSVTGHKSTKALELYERPTVQQQQAVSKVLTSGVSYAAELEKGNIERHPLQPVNRMHAQTTMRQQSHTPDFLGSMFSGLSNCSINISPQNLVVNIQQPQPAKQFDFEEFLCAMYLIKTCCVLLLKTSHHACMHFVLVISCCVLLLKTYFLNCIIQTTGQLQDPQ